MIVVRSYGLDLDFNLLNIIAPAIFFSLLLIIPIYLFSSSVKLIVKVLSILGLILFIFSSYVGVGSYLGNRSYFSSPGRAQDYTSGDYGVELKRGDHERLVYSIVGIPSGILLFLVNPG